MEPLTNKVNILMGVLVTTLSYLFGKHWVLFVAFLALNFGDYLTRWLAARITGTENSKAGWLGILKKLGYWVMIALGFGMGIIFMEIGAAIGVNLEISTFIGWFVLATLMINEIRSILENLVEGGYNVPIILTKGLEIVNKAIDGKIKISDDGIEIESYLSNDRLQTKGRATLQVEDMRNKGSS